MTTEIRFYHNAPDRLRVACVLTAKACAGGKRISVFAPDGGTARHFDQMLWAFQPLAFVPHVPAGSPLAAETPVVIGTTLDVLPHDDVLINLGDELPAGFDRFELVLEIVGPSDPERAAARGRYRDYKARGYTLAAHDLAQRSGE
ncbi:DNA polymerase III subunit chi [Zoogloea dura]|jgi:DNA polymerase-3 subunit chi|uniref:DNA polymerase III subunit chi n=1 Tax=Zoogloea dura TaxID=2728840 RepID=A0A848G2M6_9RHOO|nr:DNA polymerase III subunit chi [Zoogloea dura]NML25534.1 DNA polymerase III subunit chi [Zoogloea dura]